MSRHTAAAPGDEVTLAQGVVLRLIDRGIRKHGYAPSIRELCNACGVSSSNGMSEMLRRLERKGLIRRGPKQTSRTLVVTTLGRAWLGEVMP